MGACHFVVGRLLSAGEIVPGGVGGNANIPIRLTGSKVNAVIAFCYPLVTVYALTLVPGCWICAAKAWSLETRAVCMSIASLGNWLFNFALGLCIPPGFHNVEWVIFIVFGAMCMLAAIQLYLTCPETCNKTLEEIEIMFSPDRPRPWHTKPGGSRLDSIITQAREKQYTTDDIKSGRAESTASSTVTDKQAAATQSFERV